VELSSFTGITTGENEILFFGLDQLPAKQLRNWCSDFGQMINEGRLILEALVIVFFTNG